MRKLALVVALASTAIASPAFARDGSAYLGVDLGAMRPQALKLDFTSGTTAVIDGEELKHKWGFDADLVGGYDFGMFRVEVEAGYKRAGVKNVVLNPTAAHVFGAPFGILSSDGRTQVGSGMVNALLDFGGNGDWGGSVGGGVGLARVRERAGLTSGAFNFRDSDRAFAWQAIAELRAPLSPNIDVGLKYRFFQTGNLNFGPFCVTTCQPTFALRGKYKSNSLLASLVYNFYSVAPPPPPPPPPAPPATQTCPDGSVILATSTCPPPPPPPPPPPAQRGERGE